MSKFIELHERIAVTLENATTPHSDQHSHVQLQRKVDRNTRMISLLWNAFWPNHYLFTVHTGLCQLEQNMAASNKSEMMHSFNAWCELIQEFPVKPEKLAEAMAFVAAEKGDTSANEKQQDFEKGLQYLSAKLENKKADFLKEIQSRKSKAQKYIEILD